jgi:SAM-dependent methyltransferase
MAVSRFDPVAAHYDAARPSYPEAIYDELERVTGPLPGRLVMDGGAGTGIASRQLSARGARLVAVELGELMLRRALARSPDLACVLADGHAIPLRDGCVELACFAQSWHWFNPARAFGEVARVVRPGGYWAAWWNTDGVDGSDWFRQYQAVMADACPDYHWQHRQARRDRVAEVAAATQFGPAAYFEAQWTRTIRLADWLTDQHSKSYVASLNPAAREVLFAQLSEIVSARFPDGELSVPYLTQMWLARRA